MFCRPALPSHASPHLGHEPVGARVLLIFEDDIRVVIGCQLFEALRVARYFALGSPAGSEGLLGDVGAKLFVSQRDELLRGPPLAVPPPRPAALRGRCEEEEEEEDRGTQRGGEEVEGDPHRPGGVGWLGREGAEVSSVPLRLGPRLHRPVTVTISRRIKRNSARQLRAP